jgi:anthranilate phosphoribosyltransferase
MTASIVRAISRTLDGVHLSRAEMAEVMGQIMDGEATAAQIGGFLIALRAKGEAIDELVGAASAMRARATPLDCPTASTASIPAAPAAMGPGRSTSRRSPRS